MGHASESRISPLTMIRGGAIRRKVDGGGYGCVRRARARDRAMDGAGTDPDLKTSAAVSRSTIRL